MLLWARGLEGRIGTFPCVCADAVIEVCCVVIMQTHVKDLEVASVARPLRSPDLLCPEETNSSIFK